MNKALLKKIIKEVHPNMVRSALISGFVYPIDQHDQVCGDSIGEEFFKKEATVIVELLNDLLADESSPMESIEKNKVNQYHKIQHALYLAAIERKTDMLGIKLIAFFRQYYPFCNEIKIKWEEDWSKYSGFDIQSIIPMTDGVKSTLMFPYSDGGNGEKFVLSELYDNDELADGILDLILVDKDYIKITEILTPEELAKITGGAL